MKRAINLAVALIGCVVLMSASCKRAPEATSESVTVSEPGTTDGVMSLSHSDEGCALLISVMEDGEEVFYIPVELDEKFKTEGMKINFTYHDSRMNQGSCTLGHPIVIDAIKKR
jgi:hypothetical protein